MDRICWGICGPGIIANKFARCIRQVPEAELTAVASRNPDRARGFAQLHDIPLVFDSYEAMAADDRVDAVYVSTAHPFHLDCAKLFLKAGKAVLCEKPLCVNARQAEELIACAKENGVFLMEAMWTRFLPAIRQAQQLISDGVIGRVMGLEAHFCYASTPEEEAKLFDHTMAGGSLLDVGVYGLHLAAMILGGSPREVSALSHIKDGTDLHTQVLLQYESGAIANISSATGLQKPEYACIYGTKGHMILPAFYGAQSLMLTADGETRRLDIPSIGEGFEEEIAEVCRCIRAGLPESHLLPLSETLAILRLTDNIRSQIGLTYPMD